MSLMRAGGEQLHESFCSFLVFFSPQKVLIYGVPPAHLAHLGLQVSISGITGRWGIVGDRALSEEAGVLITGAGSAP